MASAKATDSETTLNYIDGSHSISSSCMDEKRKRRMGWCKYVIFCLFYLPFTFGRRWVPTACEFTQNDIFPESILPSSFLLQLNEHNINTFKTHWHHICVYICEYTRCACSVIELVSNEKQIFRDIANRQTLREKIHRNIYMVSADNR